jgi:hypothetical protein
MRKPAYISLFVLSVVLATCAKAEFAPIQAIGTGGNGGGSGGVVGPTDDCEAAVCESAGKVVSCPTDRLCHASTTDPRPDKGGVCSGPQNDNCAPGNVCLNFGDLNSYCFQLCTSSTNCDGGACAGRTLEGSTLVRVCDPTPISCTTGSCCDPINNIGCSGRQCYLVAPISAAAADSRTVCEYESGDKKTGLGCTSSRECSPGWACSVLPEDLPAGSGSCQRVCSMLNPTCPCRPYNNQYGFCQ